MLISFLATLEGGASYSSEVAETSARNNKSTGEGSGEIKLPSLTSLLGLSLSASGKYNREAGAQDSVESKFVRQHTSASLFNNLRDRLLADGYIDNLDDKPDLTQLSPGALVEVTGELDESPLKKIVDFVRSIWPFVEQETEKARAALPSSKRNQKGSLPPEQREVMELARQAIDQQVETNQQTMAMVELVEKDLAQSPVVDLLLTTEKASAIVTASHDLLTPEVTAMLMGGRFRLLGKVCAVDPRADAETLVVRRGAMGLMADAAVLPMIDNMNEMAKQQQMNMTLPDGKIKGPFMQVIPLAIFI